MKKIQRMGLRNAYIFLVMIGVFLFAESINAQTSKSNLLFDRFADNTVLLYGYNANDVLDSVLSIPTCVKLGTEVLQVKGIADNAFRGRSSLQRVTYSNDILVIDDSNIRIYDYLNVKFATDLAPFVNYTISGEGAWKNDYSCATATGYDSKTKVTTPFAAFLVSPEINLTTATEAYVEYNYILRYNKGDENQQLMITDNFSEATPSANWTLLNNTHTEGRDYTTFSVADIQIPSEFLGKKVRIAFSYNCGADGSTWEVRDVAVKKGSFTPPTPPGPTEEGSGTYDDPFTIAGAQANQGVLGYVKGYIVGFVTGQVLASGATFSAEGAVASNILIAKTADETDVNNCILVQLVGNSPVRAGINLADNPGMYKKELLIYGSLEKYFGAAGLKSTTYAECDGKTFGTKPGDDPKPVGEGYFMDFITTGSQGDWTIENKSIDPALSYVWTFDSKYGMKASAYISECLATESWLISPAINLPVGVNTLTIHHAMNQLKGANRADHVNVMISTDKTNWSVVNMTGWPAGTDWNFGDYTADFSAYAGKTIYIAFKYTSTENCAPTWEIEKLSISNNNQNSKEESFDYKATNSPSFGIGNNAFCGCKSLKSVTIPNFVTSIGDGAFEYCSGLTDVTLNSDAIVNKTYEYNSNISKIFGTQVQKYTIGDDVIGIGSCAFYGCYKLKELTIGNSVTSIGDWAFYNCSGLTSVTIGNSVTSIGDYAFYGCKGLTSIEIPNSVTSIGYQAFRNCSSLTSVTIGNSVTSIRSCTFENCTSLTSITIPNSVISIGDRAFYNCSGLTSVNITDLDKWAEIEFYNDLANPLYYAKKLYLNGELVTDAKLTSATKIGSCAFYQCSGLTSITIPNSVTSIGDAAFCECSGLTSITIGNSVTSIGKNAFSDCTSLPVENNLRYADTYLIEAVDKTLSTYTIKEGAKWIGNSAFYECSGLTSIEIPNSVTSIGSCTFENCTSLTSIDIPNSVTSIGGSAFRNCSSLTSVTIGNSVTSIESSAFAYCSGLTAVTIGNSVTSIGDYAFYGCSDMESIVLPDVLKEIGNNAFTNTCLTSIDIPNSVTSIGKSAFSGCKVLSDVKIGKSVEIIGDYAFYECLCIDSIDIPYGTIAIGDYAFSGCQSLKKVKIPSSVQEIGGYTFYKCPNLEDVYVCWNKPISIGSSVFDKTNGYVLSTLLVPIGRMNFYKVTDTWGKFVEIKEWDSSTGIEEIGLTPALHTREGATYNLQGVKVNDVKQGEIYIRNGRKFIAK